MKVVLWGFIVWYCFSYPLLYFEMLEPFYAVISHSSGFFFFLLVMLGVLLTWTIGKVMHIFIIRSTDFCFRVVSIVKI